MTHAGVSIIIPSHNRPAFLREAVQSALNQTVQPCEILIVDNGSDPEHVISIAHVADGHSCIRFIGLEHNYGPGFARNIGIEAAIGKWILFLDDDDVLLPGFLAACIEAIAAKDNTQMVIGRAVNFKDGDRASFPRGLISGYDLSAFGKDPITALYTDGIAIGSCMVRRDAIGHLRFPAHLWRGEDSVFWAFLMPSIVNLATTEGALLGRRLHPGQITAGASKVKWRRCSDDSILAHYQILIDSLDGQVPWLAFFLRCRRLYHGGGIWRLATLVFTLLGRPDFSIRIAKALGKRQMFRAGVLPFRGRPSRGHQVRPGPPKPRMLFICGVVPSPSGTGLAMRPYHQLTVLAQTYTIHLLLALIHPHETRISDGLRGLCQDIEIIPRTRYTGWSYRIWWRWRRWLGDALAKDLASPRDLTRSRLCRSSHTFERIHVFRLYLASLGLALKPRFPSAHTSLDMDDLESQSRHSMATVHRCLGDVRNANFSLRESQGYLALEDRLIPRFDEVFAASSLDQASLSQRFPDTTVLVLPNVVTLPAMPSKLAVTRGRRLSLLFVGSLSYFPNADALRYFSTELAPALDALEVDWRLRVVGASPRAQPFQGRVGDSRWTWAGQVEDLGPVYHAADLVLAPIRCGGGTRIKVLEAFAHEVPVVATAKAVEGLPVQDGVHFLLAETPSGFAQACARIWQDPDLGRTLAVRAVGLIRSRFTPEALAPLWPAGKGGPIG